MSTNATSKFVIEAIIEYPTEKEDIVLAFLENSLHHILPCGSKVVTSKVIEHDLLLLNITERLSEIL